MTFKSAVFKSQYAFMSFEMELNVMSKNMSWKLYEKKHGIHIGALYEQNPADPNGPMIETLYQIGTGDQDLNSFEINRPDTWAKFLELYSAKGYSGFKFENQKSDQTYFSFSKTDVIKESIGKVVDGIDVNGMNDTLYTNHDYTMPAMSGIEVLSGMPSKVANPYAWATNYDPYKGEDISVDSTAPHPLTLLDSPGVHLTGNKRGQTIFGSDGNDVINGKGGIDTLNGGAYYSSSFNYDYKVADPTSKYGIKEVVVNAPAPAITANGNDDFVFDTATRMAWDSNGNVTKNGFEDAGLVTTIEDFVSGQDRVLLDDKVFKIFKGISGALTENDLHVFHFNDDATARAFVGTGFDVDQVSAFAGMKAWLIEADGTAPTMDSFGNTIIHNGWAILYIDVDGGHSGKDAIHVMDVRYDTLVSGVHAPTASDFVVI